MCALVDLMRGGVWDSWFPLRTTLVVAEHFEQGLSKHIYEKVLSVSDSDNFLPQQRVYATKPRGHLRRTVKLDPVAEYYIYDLAVRNRAIFRKQVSDRRASFGYRFKDGKPLRSEEHTSELQSLMRISYAVFCLNKNNISRAKPKKL